MRKRWVVSLSAFGVLAGVGGGFVAWHHFGGATSGNIPIQLTSGNNHGMVPDHCVVNQSGTEAIASGTFTPALPHQTQMTQATYTGRPGPLEVQEQRNGSSTSVAYTIVLGVTNSAGDTLGEVTGAVYSGTSNWQLDAHLKEGFSPAKCWVGVQSGP